MKDGCNVTEQMRRQLDTPQEIVSLDVIGESKWNEVPPLLIVTEEISYQDVLEAAAHLRQDASLQRAQMRVLWAETQPNCEQVAHVLPVSTPDGAWT